MTLGCVESAINTKQDREVSGQLSSGHFRDGGTEANLRVEVRSHNTERSQRNI